MGTFTSTPKEIPATLAGRKRRFLLNRNFALLWMGQTISELGSHITNQGLPLTANLLLNATAAQMGLLAAIGMLPVLLIGLLAGAWVDRLHRRPILIIADIARFLLLLSIPIAAVLGLLHIEQLYIVAALIGLLTVFFTVANQALLPLLVPHEQIIEANSKLSASSSLAEVGGPTLAGILVQAITAPLAILFDALSFLFSAFCITLLHIQEPEPVLREEHQNLWQDIRAGLHAILADPVLRAITLSASTRSFCGGAFAALYGLFLIRELGVTPLLYGILVGFGGIGALLGAFMAHRLAQRFSIGKILVSAALLDGIMMPITPLARGSIGVIIIMLLCAQLVGDFAYVIYSIHALSLRQAVLPDHIQGRANASAHVLVEGMVPLGALLAGFTAQVFGMRTILLIASCLSFLLSSAWLVCSPVWKLRKEPAKDM